LPLLENEARQKGTNIFAQFEEISNGKDATESLVSKIAFRKWSWLLAVGHGRILERKFSHTAVSLDFVR
jgi:hypothetical protein